VFYDVNHSTDGRVLSLERIQRAGNPAAAAAGSRPNEKLSACEHHLIPSSRQRTGAGSFLTTPILW